MIRPHQIVPDFLQLYYTDEEFNAPDLAYAIGVMWGVELSTKVVATVLDSLDARGVVRCLPVSAQYRIYKLVK